MLTMIASLLAAGVVLVFGWWSFGGEASWGRRLFRAYARWVEESLRPLFVRLTPQAFALRHFGGAVAAAALFYLFGGPLWAVLAGSLAVVLGFRWPKRRQAKRRARLEAQLDTTLRSISQTLRATANIVDAFETVARQLDPPMSQEIEVLLRQHRLGMTLEDALREVSARTGSRNLDAATTAIVIGRLTGGNLPEILDECAAVLRERMRLEAVIDARTAEGKAQASVIGLMPVALGVAVYLLDPSFMAPMFTDPIGWVILGIICALSGLGFYFVRKVSVVDV